MSNSTQTPVNFFEQVTTLSNCVGNTPLVSLQRLPQLEGVDTQVQVLAKLEGNNPASSVKDRPAFNMIHQAEQRGQRRGGARAGLLVLGRGPNGRRRLAGAPRTYPGLSRNSRARRASASILGFFSCGGEAATHAKRQTRRRGRP